MSQIPYCGANYLLRVVIVLLAVLLAGGCSSPRQSVRQSTSLYDKVLSAGEIRCSYLIYPPYCLKDPNTGRLSGMFVETMEAVGNKLGLRINWSEEVGYESLFEGLRANRYDVFAGGLWPNSARGKIAEFSKPLFYSSLRAYGRGSDSRLTNNLDELNSPKFKIAVIDGAMEDLIARTDFPKAQRLSLTQLSPFSQNLLNVASAKADVTFAEPGIVKIFLRDNPASLKELAPEKPLRIFGNAYVFKLGEVKFASMFNTALDELINDGTVERLLRKYEPAPGAFLRTALPYRALPDGKRY